MSLHARLLGNSIRNMRRVQPQVKFVANSYSERLLHLLYQALGQGGDQLNVNHEVVNQIDVNQPNPTQRSLFLLINQLNIIMILS